MCPTALVMWHAASDVHGLRCAIVVVQTVPRWKCAWCRRIVALRSREFVLCYHMRLRDIVPGNAGGCILAGDGGEIVDASRAPDSPRRNDAHRS
eukprot:8937875-Pyramimonas_sp.AAC.1